MSPSRSGVSREDSQTYGIHDEVRKGGQAAVDTRDDLSLSAVVEQSSLSTDQLTLSMTGIGLVLLTPEI